MHKQKQKTSIKLCNNYIHTLFTLNLHIFLYNSIDKLYKGGILKLQVKEALFMKKSLYSLMLRDGIVREVDRAAHRAGLTRSGMINKILAEYFGYATPETRRRDIFSSLLGLLEADESFFINSGIEDSLFALRSSLRFKYNPTVKYSIAVYPEAGEYFGELRAQLRSQNAELISSLDIFFAMWQRLEDAYFGARLSEFGGGKFIRRLRAPEGASAESLGKSAAGYIRLLNRAINAYFEVYPDVDAAFGYISKIYGDYINKGKELV